MFKSVTSVTDFLEKLKLISCTLGNIIDVNLQVRAENIGIELDKMLFW